MTNRKKVEKDFSAKEKEFAERHPLLSQLGLNILAGIIAGGIVAWWVANNLPPKPEINWMPTLGDNSEITIQNRGYIPASREYIVASADSVAPVFSIVSGEKYVEILDTEKNNVKKAVVRDLPKSKKIEINIEGSKNITINNN
jgi:hypothetical protein